MSRIASETGAPVAQLSEHRWQEIVAAPLEGNVRELENLLHRAIALGDGGDSGFGDLEPPSTPTPPHVQPDTWPAETINTAGNGQIPGDSLPTDLGAWLDEQERRVLVQTLTETGFNRTAAAQRLGLNLRQIRYRMARLGITAPGQSDDHADDAN